VFDALAVEGQDVPQHPQITGRKQISRLRKQPCCRFPPTVATAFPLEAAAIARHGKVQPAFYRLDAEVVEHRSEIWVVEFIVDGEADIDRDRRPVIVDADGMAMPARPD